jgi:hypothetical protein
MKIVILGWGSLLWDRRPEFDEQHEDWLFDGPYLKLEFSRVSESRGHALTLVLDKAHGKVCRVAYAFSKRKDPEDTICDLRSREGTIRRKIGFYSRDGSMEQSRDEESFAAIRDWARNKHFDVVVWTDLESNFTNKSKGGKDFSVDSALSHIQSLDPEGKAKAAEYVWSAPDFIDTPVRNALQLQPWFPKRG